MKKQLFALTLAVFVSVALSGCGAKIESEVASSSESTASNTTAVTEKIDETEQEALLDETDAEESDTNNTASVASETIESSAPSNLEEKQTDNPITESSHNAQPPTTEEIATTEPVKTPKSTKEPETIEEPEPTKVAEQEKEQTTEAPTIVPETSEPVQSFDIAYWISYAKSYAQSKGLILNSEATECWDNPIGAGAHCIYLERDIQSRINRYANDEEITDVWIWYESTGNNTYEIYIGYA